VTDSPYVAASSCKEREGLYAYENGGKEFLVKFLEEVITDLGSRWRFEVVIAPSKLPHFEGLGFQLHAGDHLRQLTDMEVLAVASR